MNTSITISFEIDLMVSEVWPDLDHPTGRPVTADDVIAIMRRTGSPTRVVQDWDLIDMLHVSVRDGDSLTSGVHR